MIKSKVVARLASAQASGDIDGVRRWSGLLESIESREAELRIEELSRKNRMLDIELDKLAVASASLSFDIEASQF